MKKMWLCVFAAMLCMMAIGIESAQAYTSAGKRITIYNQYKKQSDTYYYSYENGFGLRNGTKITDTKSSFYGMKDCLAQGGCRTFAYAHAIQWLTGKKMGDELLRELVAVCCAPSNNHGHSFEDCKTSAYPHDDSRDAFHSFMKESTLLKSNNLNGTRKGLPSVSGMTDTAMKQFFNDGYIMTGTIRWDDNKDGNNDGGHIILAVDYALADSLLYIQVIDSCSSSATKKSTRPFYNAHYTYDGTTMTKNEGALSGGKQYWVPWNTFKKKFTMQSKLWGGSWTGHQEELKIGNFDLVAEIQAVVYTRDDKGITEYKLQKEPYAAAETVKTVAPCTYLTTTGVYKNKHGNYWLKFTNDTYLCANDVELVFQVDPPVGADLVYPTGNLTLGKSFDLKGTITSQSTMPEVWAVVSKPDDESFTPVTAKLTNVTSVDIYTSALNKSSLGGISFSKLPKGDYSFSLWAYYYEYKNVEKTSSVPLSVKQVYLLEGKPFTVGDGGSGTTEEVNDAVDLCTLNAKFSYNKDTNTHKLPYAAATKLGTLKAGQSVTVTKLVQNRYNNIWAQLSDGSYVCFYDKTTGEHHMTFQSTNALKVSDDVKKPTGDIPLATSFGLRGTITADMPIYSVTAKVTNRATEDVAVGPVTATSAKGAFTKSVTMNKALNGVNINDKMSFKKLTAAGYYRYEVVVQLGFIYAFDGEVFQFGTEQVAISSDFTAGNPEDEELLPDVPDEPTLTRLPGDANDDAVVDIYDALLILQYDAGWNVSLNTSNADVNADNLVDIYDALLVLQYDAGWNVVLK